MLERLPPNACYGVGGSVIDNGTRDNDLPLICKRPIDYRRIRVVTIVDVVIDTINLRIIREELQACHEGEEKGEELFHIRRRYLV